MSPPSPLAFFKALAMLGSTIPECTKTVRPVSFFILPIACVKPLRGTDPSGKHPPLTKHPLAPAVLRRSHNSTSSFGVVAGYIVSRTTPPQCLHFIAQFLPVTEIVGKSEIDELK